MYQDCNSTKQSQDQKGEVNAETRRENNTIIIKIVMPVYNLLAYNWLKITEHSSRFDKKYTGENICTVAH
jgi:hypothetical protein